MSLIQWTELADFELAQQESSHFGSMKQFGLVEALVLVQVK